MQSKRLFVSILLLFLASFSNAYAQSCKEILKTFDGKISQGLERKLLEAEDDTLITAFLLAPDQLANLDIGLKIIQKHPADKGRSYFEVNGTKQQFLEMLKSRVQLTWAGLTKWKGALINTEEAAAAANKLPIPEDITTMLAIADPARRISVEFEFHEAADFQVLEHQLKVFSDHIKEADTFIYNEQLPYLATIGSTPAVMKKFLDGLTESYPGAVVAELSPLRRLHLPRASSPMNKEVFEKIDKKNETEILTQLTQGGTLTLALPLGKLLPKRTTSFEKLRPIFEKLGVVCLSFDENAFIPNTKRANPTQPEMAPARFLTVVGTGADLQKAVAHEFVTIVMLPPTMKSAKDLN